MNTRDLGAASPHRWSKLKTIAVFAAAGVAFSGALLIGRHASRPAAPSRMKGLTRFVDDKGLELDVESIPENVRDLAARQLRPGQGQFHQVVLLIAQVAPLEGADAKAPNPVARIVAELLQGGGRRSPARSGGDLLYSWIRCGSWSRLSLQYPGYEMIVVEIPPITTEGTVVFLGELRLRRAFDPSEARIVRGRLIAEPGSLLPEKGEVSINVGDYAPLQTVGLEGDGFSISNVYPGTYGITVISRHYARSWASLTVSTQSPPSIEILHTMHPTRIIRGRLHTSTRVTREFRLESDGNHDLLFGLLPGERISFISFDSQLNLACPSGAVAVTAGEYEGMGSIEAMLLNSDVRVDWERPSWTGRLQPGDLVAVLQRGVEDGSGVGGPRRPLRIPAVIEVLAVEPSPAASPTSDHARAEAGTSPRGDAGTPIRLTIDRAEMESWLRNLNVLAAQARIVPYLENGRPNGFKIFAIKPGSAFTRLGLEDNDVVLRIDGIPMSSPDNALTAYKRLNDGCLPGSAPACRLITLDLLREGRPLALEYHIP